VKEGKLKRKELEKESRREFILEAARKIFAEKGIENTTMEDIAVKAEYTRRTLYSYFKSFDEICLTVLMADQKIRWEKQKMVIGAADTGLEKLRAWAKTLFLFACENPQYIRLEYYWDYHGIDPKLIGQRVFNRFKQRNDELADGLRDIFEIGMADKSICPDLCTDMCISHFLYSLRSIINRALSTGYSFAKFKAKDYFEHYLALFCRGISNQ
jgi:AcrR family transcriptional regulator